MLELIERCAQEAPVLTEVVLHYGPFALIAAVIAVVERIKEALGY